MTPRLHRANVTVIVLLGSLALVVIALSGCSSAPTSGSSGTSTSGRAVVTTTSSTSTSTSTTTTTSTTVAPTTTAVTPPSSTTEATVARSDPAPRSNSAPQPSQPQMIDGYPLDEFVPCKVGPDGVIHDPAYVVSTPHGFICAPGHQNQ